MGSRADKSVTSCRRKRCSLNKLGSCKNAFNSRGAREETNSQSGQTLRREKDDKIPFLTHASGRGGGTGLKLTLRVTS